MTTENEEHLLDAEESPSNGNAFPTDAEVREAVESLVQAIGWAGMHQQGDDEVAQVSVSEARTLLSYVLAVQAPRLTGEQVKCLKNIHIALTTNGLEGAAWELRAAFPEAFNT